MHSNAKYPIKDFTSKNLSKSNFRTSTIESKSGKSEYDLIVFCHLRWDFVYQRPQHIISRFANYMRVLFVEEPILKSEEGNSVRVIHDNLHILQPNIADLDELDGVLYNILGSTELPIAWFYSPSFGGVTDTFSFTTIVYDCMDELSLFKGAPKKLIEQELQLLKKATVVFTGGKSLFEAKFPLHPNVHCFPSSVDLEHFSQALNGISIPEELMSLTTPVIGYYGVVDERMDLELIEEAAKLLPDCSFVFVGPVVKIHENDLPQLPNIYYLGIRPYSMLPHFLKGFDIAMMPFALNESTKYISPTKTLEYMAAGKPIISTHVRDVVRDYSGCVGLINNAQEFVNEIQKILNNEVRPKTNLYESILKKTSWDTTVYKMRTILKATVKK